MMNDIENILLFVLLIVSSVFVGYLIFALKRITRSLDVLMTELKSIREDLSSTLQNISMLSVQARDTLKEFEEQKENLGVAISNVKKFTNNFLRIQEFLLTKIEPPLQEFGSILSSFTKGYETFRATWRRKRS